MTVTAHFIDSDWKLQSFVLETLSFHTGVNIADKLKGVWERWGITQNVVTVSHDQASNMEAAMDMLTEDCNWLKLSLLCPSPTTVCFSRVKHQHN